jgi:chromosome segregation ATPase
MARSRAGVLLIVLLTPSVTSSVQNQQPLTECQKRLLACRENPSQCLEALETCCGLEGKLRAEAEQSRVELAKCTEQQKKLENELDQLRRERLLPQQKKELEDEIAGLRAEGSKLQNQNAQIESGIRALEAKRRNLLANVDELRRLKGVFQNPELRGRATRLLSLLQGKHRPETISYVKEARFWGISFPRRR